MIDRVKRIATATLLDVIVSVSKIVFPIPVDKTVVAVQALLPASGSSDSWGVTVQHATCILYSNQSHACNTLGMTSWA